MKKIMGLLLVIFVFSCSLNDENSKESSNAFGVNNQLSRSNKVLEKSLGKRPFPQNVGLPSGFTQPSGNLQSDLENYYNMWANISVNPLTNTMDGYLMRDSYMKDGKKYTIVRADATGSGTGKPSLSSQSEAHGFGMITLALMEDNDNSNINEHKEFDSMYNLSRKFKWNGTNLMHWEIPPEGVVNLEGPATDGDVTIAYALLLADKQWGTGSFDDGTTINYKSEAINILKDIKRFQINNGGGPGNPWPTLGNDEWLLEASRPSDWMIDVYMEFYKATGDVIFKNVAENIVRNIAYIQNNYSQNTGLVPDFVDNSSGTLKPASNDLTGPIGTDESNEGDFYYNACRVPYRLARAAALYPQMTVDGVSIKELISKFNNWYIGNYPQPIQQNDDPINYPTTTGWEGLGIAGLTLEGNPLTIEGTNTKVFWSDNCFNSSFATSLMLSGNQDYINKMYTLTNNFDGWGPHDPGENEYYGYFADTITLLSKIIISGNWWNPSEEISPEPKLISENKPAFSSSYIQGYDPKYINDSNDSTLFGVEKSSNAPWIYLDLENEYLLEKITIDWYEEYFSSSYSIGISKDSKNWQIFNVTSDGGIDIYSSLSSFNLNGRYIGILFNNGPQSVYGVKELKIYTK